MTIDDNVRSSDAWDVLPLPCIPADPPGDIEGSPAARAWRLQRSEHDRDGHLRRTLGRLVPIDGD